MASPHQEFPAKPPLEYFLDNIHEGVVTFDHEWRYTYVNRAAAELAGKLASALLGKTVWEVFPRAVGTSLYTEVHRVAADRQHRHFEEYYPDSGRWLEVDAYPTNDGLIVISRDITDHKRAAEKLQSKYEQLQVLFELAVAISHVQNPSEIYPAAVQSLVRAVGAERASLLIFDPDDVMRFKAWIGLSDEYRAAVEGHTPWRRGVRDAQPIVVPDVMQDPTLVAYRQVLAKEGIRAVAFIPLLGKGGLIGKFMLYYNTLHQFHKEELQIAQTIATHVAFATERQESETALRDSEERFRAIFSQAAVGIAQTSPNGKWLLLNDRFCEILSYTQAELLGKTFLDFTHPADREPSLAAVRRLLEGEISWWSTEKRYLRKDGAIVWARLCISLVRDQDNRPQYFISVVEDVTERVRVERALRESEERLVLAQNAARLGVWDWDLLTNTHTVSGDYLRLYGLPPDHPTITYQEWLSMIHSDDRERVQALLRESLERTRIWDTEFRVEWPDGSIHWLLGKGTVFLDAVGVPVRMTGVNLDITERKQAEAELRASELQYKEVFDNISVCMFLLDVTSDGRFKFTHFNPAEEKAVGLSNAAISGKFVEEVFAEELAQKLTANYRRCLEARAPLEYDEELKLPGGRRYFHSNLIPLRNATGHIHRIVGVCIDVTDWKRAEAAVRRSLDEIAHVNRVAAMGELAASLAHELNQPLAAILLNSEAAKRFLSSRRPDLARVRACLNAIAVDDERAGQVIQRIRGLLKKAEPQASLVSVNEVVGDALRLVANDALLRHVSVKFEPLPGLAPVLGDRIQLYQVVLNLIVNGLDAVAERAPGDRWVLARTAEADGGGVELTVADSGKGIAECDLARLFEPFFSTKREGLGVGLSISHAIVQAHGGRIWAENSPGSGAIFHCVLPLARQTAAASTK